MGVVQTNELVLSRVLDYATEVNASVQATYQPMAER